MTEKELKKEYGITSFAIMLYEKNGLIGKIRRENKKRYFTYSDREKLKQILVLRKIGIEISDIEKILKDSDYFKKIIRDKIEYYKEKNMKGVLEVCMEIDTSDFNADLYWNM